MLRHVTGASMPPLEPRPKSPGIAAVQRQREKIARNLPEISHHMSDTEQKTIRLPKLQEMLSK